MDLSLLLSDYTFRTVTLGSALLGLVAGTLGVLSVLRRQSLIGDVAAHAALPGIALAFLLTGERAHLTALDRWQRHRPAGRPADPGAGPPHPPRHRRGAGGQSQQLFRAGHRAAHRHSGVGQRCTGRAGTVSFRAGGGADRCGLGSVRRAGAAGTRRAGTGP
ncbi:hypothetical protein EJ104_09245 [Deinococcus radiophilus]|uniref:Metal ABC transporter permease n=1 Tax=Deinococcus radiophilus TaxID=32062 RepID=A0A431VSA5_9DEIO|nr:hypothetical protein EJ104_09245 [Deinococcus radiophilus]